MSVGSPRGALCGAALVLAWGEVAAWRASRSDLPVAPRDAPVPGRTQAVVVLGFPGRRDGRPGLVQHYRVRVAVRSREPEAGRSVLVLTGRSPHRPADEPSEAAVMAELAVERFGVSRSDVVLEEEARTTWENVARTLPLVRGFDEVVIASDTFHARKARRYLRRQDPATWARLRRAGDYRFGELVLIKPLLALLRL
ncbi:YdcF family protein [Luteimicrobium sp. DT211]|uniref:YdcF family protein n=1 Tax=Luteimicrobium sp. DT211 TaxID=3393412 RepID=UPI003CEDFC15